jgi:hypothetical protein
MKDFLAVITGRDRLESLPRQTISHDRQDFDPIGSLCQPDIAKVSNRIEGGKHRLRTRFSASGDGPEPTARRHNIQEVIQENSA